MSVLVQIGNHYINPINVAYVEATEIAREVTEKTTVGLSASTREHIPGVQIKMIGSDADEFIVVTGVKVEEVVALLNVGINSMPSET